MNAWIKYLVDSIDR